MRFTTTSIALSAAFLVFSCASSPHSVEISSQISSQSEQTTQAEQVQELEEKQEKKSEKTSAERYEERIKDVVLTVSSYPKNVTAGTPFPAPYVIHAEKNGEALSDFKITAYFLGIESFLETDANGNAEYTPETPKKSMVNSISFFPTAIEGSATKDFDLFIACMNHSVRSPYVVHTANLTKGGIILILDMNEDGKTFDDRLLTCSAVQGVLRKLGFTAIGNGPDFSEAILEGSDEKVYTEAQRLLGKSYTGFLTYGTIKTIATEKTADGYITTLMAHIISIDMQTKQVIATVDFFTSGSGKTQEASIAEARNVIAKEIGGSIYYNL